MPAAHAGGQPQASFGTPREWALTAAIAVAGGLAGRRGRLPAAVLLGPMILAGVLTLRGRRSASPCRRSCATWPSR